MLTKRIGQGTGRQAPMRQFGIGRFGDFAVDNVKTLTIVGLVITIGCLVAVAGGLKFNGAVDDVLKADTPGYRALQAVETDFHRFSTDEVIVVEADNLAEAESQTALEDLIADLNLVEGVAASLSIFTLPGGGALDEPFLNSAAGRALPPDRRLQELLKVQPLAGDLLSADLTTTIVVLMVAQDDPASETVLSQAARDEIAAIAEDYESILSVAIAGMAEIHRSIEDALRKDQKLLATVSTLLCVVFSLAVFRSWRGALICAVPPIAGALWFFGFAALAGIVIDPITTIIPTLLIVVGFADSVHLYFSFLRRRRVDGDLKSALATTIRQTGPACFLTSLTTAIACLGIGVAGSETLNAFAVGGFFGMAIQFLAILLLFPTLAMLLAPRKLATEGGRELRFAPIGRAATGLLSQGWRVIAFSVALFALLFYAQSQLQVGFSLSEHLQAGSPLKQLEKRLTEKSLGSGQLFVVVDDVDGVDGFGAADSRALETIGKALYGETAGTTFPSAEQIERLSEEDQPLLRRFVSRDQTRYLLPVSIDTSLLSAAIVAEAEAIRERIRRTGFDGAFDVVGLPLLSATEVPKMISDLRLGFYLALALVVLLLMFATGSIRLGLISLIPNLIPILGVEAILFASSQTLTMTAAVALTIAFGIAVDNSIHLLNRYQHGRTEPAPGGINEALLHVAPPITATTILLVAGLFVTQFSSLPTVATFGTLVSAALVLALFSSLFLLPAFVDPGANNGAVA